MAPPLDPIVATPVMATVLYFAWKEKLQVLYEDLQVLYENLQVLYEI